MTCTVEIESLKELYLKKSKECEVHFEKINAALRKCAKNIEAIRSGYTAKWDQFNRLDTFFRKNNIHFYEKYEDQRIEISLTLIEEVSI